MAIDFNELEEALRKMHPRTRLYDIVKAEMVKRGRWKNKPKGIPFQKGVDKRRNDKQFR